MPRRADGSWDGSHDIKCEVCDKILVSNDIRYLMERYFCREHGDTLYPFIKVQADKIINEFIQLQKISKQVIVRGT